MSFIQSSGKSPEITTEPVTIPRTVAEFNALSYGQRLWLHENHPGIYNKLVRESGTT